MIDGEPIRARVYPWGLVEVDNPHHSDFVRLRGAMLGQVVVLYAVRHRLMNSFPSSSHLGDLKTLTEDVLYETYRTEKLSKSILESRFVFNKQLVWHVMTFCACSETEMLPEDLANHSVLAKEQELVKEQERVRYLSYLCDLSH